MVWTASYGMAQVWLCLGNWVLDLDLNPCILTLLGPERQSLHFQFYLSGELLYSKQGKPRMQVNRLLASGASLNPLCLTGLTVDLEG